MGPGETELSWPMIADMETLGAGQGSASSSCFGGSLLYVNSGRSYLVLLASFITDIQQAGELQLGPRVRESAQAAAIGKVPHADFPCVGCSEKAPPAGIKGHGRQLCVPMQVHEVPVPDACVGVPYTDCPAVIS